VSSNVALPETTPQQKAEVLSVEQRAKIGNTASVALLSADYLTPMDIEASSREGTNSLDV